MKHERLLIICTISRIRTFGKYKEVDIPPISPQYSTDQKMFFSYALSSNHPNLNQIPTS